MSHCAGSMKSPRRAERDADVVQLLKDAGAIIICVTNTPELCMSWECFNFRIGRTLNPYDTRRTCGGSSGGEAVLLAACGSLIGVGSDYVGSGRLPPSYCGVYGHRTSGYLTSGDLHFPSLSAPEVSMCPMARNSVDLPLLLKCMVTVEKHEMLKPEAIDAQNIRVFYMFDSGSNFPTSRVNTQIVNAMKKVVQHLDENGIINQHVQLKSFEDQFDVMVLNLLSKEGVYEAMSYKNLSVIGEFVRTIFCCPRVILNIIMFQVMYKLFKLLASSEHIEKHRKLADQMKAELEELLGDDGVLLYPTFTKVAGIHGSIYSYSQDAAYLGIFNVLNLPVTAIPIGLDSNGLPIGIQVIGKENNDMMTMAFARFMETSFGGWTPPSYTNIKT